MNKIVVIILISIILISCKENKRKSKINQNNNEKVTFDSTYLNQLKKSYNEKDTLLLSIFFRNWHNISKEKKCSNSKISNSIESIFNEIYHPFILEKYGWLERPHYSKYKYAILPTKIKFRKVKSFALFKDKNDFSMYSIDFDTIKSFFPKPDIGSTKIVYNIAPFKTAMQVFLDKNSYSRLSFLDSTNFINSPISNDWKQYLTSPEIIGILINNKMDSAIVDLRLISTGIRIYLNKGKENWKMKKINQLWIE